MVGNRAEMRNKMIGLEGRFALGHKLAYQRIIRDQKVIAEKVGGRHELLIIGQQLGIDDQTLDRGEALQLEFRRIRQIVLKRNDSVQPVFLERGAQIAKAQTFVGDAKVRVNRTAVRHDLGQKSGSAPAFADAEPQRRRGV